MKEMRTVTVQKEPADSNKRKQIWSVLLTLTLLVSWSLIPNRPMPEPLSDVLDWVLYGVYKAAYWCLVFSLFWIVAGRRAVGVNVHQPQTRGAGFSIWSIVVFTGLLAVWMTFPGMPNLSPPAFGIQHASYFFWHQLAFWTWLATLLWLVTGRRWFVLLISFTILTIVWLPLAVMLTDFALTSNVRTSSKLINKTGTLRVCLVVYRTLYDRFGYGHSKYESPVPLPKVGT